MPARPLPQKPSAAWLQEGYGHIWMPYTQMQTAPLPQAAVATEGTRIILSEGTQLIDGVSSWWSACHGYNHPHIIDAITAQAQQMPHVMLAGLGNEPAFTLAGRLAALAPRTLNRVFFSESGSISVEIAMKMATQYWMNKGDTKRQTFMCFKDAYHGDSIATMSVGDPEDGIHGRFNGLMPSQHRVALPRDEKTTRRFEAAVAEHASTIAAVLLEPLVQGAGGMIFHDTETLATVRRVCDDHGVLLILDEIMTGLGRLGTMFACEQAAIVPDIMTLSKSLTGGTVPLAATIANDRVFEAFLDDDLNKALMHGPTFTGNALACAAANASLDLFETEPRLEQVHTIEAHLRTALEPCRNVKGAWGNVVDVRVAGAIGVVELDDIQDMNRLRARFIEAGCWIRPFGKIVYLMPAFTIAEDDLAVLTDTVVRVIGET
ncbi:MAG: adenosylmethionine--8-amino-7-oxononanoate transaminase [Alphaproteobacteria bacterium]|jgi:adenosylmethionine---8-amino-7-oxononanoate aminotransferase|nr:adenosylmethionine--8-amino-7-oxononanoate transaminase [Alphaproteobacteria bacterium]MBT7944141.1 adenosylmethionine--8-amino-7-oxononanoate transaminase [Alphaproteobacteria bacterium]